MAVPGGRARPFFHLAVSPLDLFSAFAIDLGHGLTFGAIPNGKNVVFFFTAHGGAHLLVVVVILLLLLPPR